MRSLWTIWFITTLKSRGWSICRVPNNYRKTIAWAVHPWNPLDVRNASPVVVTFFVWGQSFVSYQSMKELREHYPGLMQFRKDRFASWSYRECRYTTEVVKQILNVNWYKIARSNWKSQMIQNIRQVHPSITIEKCLFLTSHFSSILPTHTHWVNKNQSYVQTLFARCATFYPYRHTKVSKRID